MNKYIFKKLFLFLVVLLIINSEDKAQGKFYKEYWAKLDTNITLNNTNHWRVNDESVSLHERYGPRNEPKANGLLMIPIEEDLFMLEKSELYLELWGGHIKSENKRFYLNGRGPYFLPYSGTEDSYHTFSNPTIPIKIKNLVNGKNAFQFSMDKAESFWGHYIVAQANLKCYLKTEHPILDSLEIKGFNATVIVNSKNNYLKDITPMSLSYKPQYASLIDSVVYIARYAGFDDKGLLKENYWHGFTMKKKYVNHVGTSEVAPFKVNWDTEMIPNQSGAMAIKAIVYLNNGLNYETDQTGNLIFPKERHTIRMYKCEPFPALFSSRINKEKTVDITLQNDISNIEKAQLVVKNWGRHHGHNEDPFKLNGYPYDLFSQKVSAMVSFSKIDINPNKLVHGANTITIFSDTKHHPLEIYLPGPILLIKEKK